MKNIFAKIISRVFGVWELLIIYLLLIFKTGLTWDQIKILIPLTLILEVALPLGILIFMLVTKRISDWDITDRKQRPKFFLSVFVALALSMTATYWLTGLTVYLWIKLSILAIFAIIILITEFYKISIHITMNMLVVILTNFLVSFYFLPLVLMIPLVAWSRYVLKKHTPGQMLAAILLNSLIIIPLVILL